MGFVLRRATLLRGLYLQITSRPLPTNTHSPCGVRIGNSAVRGLCVDELTDISKTEKQLTERPREKKTELFVSGEIK
jgi:hypothetical protein